MRDNTDRITHGEIAPLPWFGTESLAEAIALCHSFGDRITLEQIQGIADQYPACQFGFETAVRGVGITHVDSVSVNNRKFCQLLSRSGDILEQLAIGLQSGYQTFKLKIALDHPSSEIELCDKIIAHLPEQAKLRLDANGGLNIVQARQWLTWGDRQSKLEFIEQPLPPEHFTQLLELQTQFKTAIALDESVTNIKDLQHCYEQGWRGVYVIKAAIAGFPSRLSQFCQGKNLDLVFSTVFETAIGKQAVLDLAATLANPARALGMGGDRWFAETP